MTNATPPTENDSLLSEAVRLRRAVNRRVLPIYVLVAAMMAIGLVVGVNFKNDRDRGCRTSQQNRDVLKQVITVAYNSQTGQLDLTKFQHFQGLDPATKAWVNDFQSLINLGNTAASPNDKDRNHVPDEVDKVMNQPVC